MSEILVKPEQIRVLADHVNRGAADLDETVRRLYNEFNGSNEYWRGHAREQFTQAFQEWDTTWKNMHSSLQNMQNLINHWVAEAERLDQSVRR
jgi:WXG100 family type VII secretion target